MTAPRSRKSSRTAPAQPTPFDPVSEVCASHFPHLDPDVPRILLAAWLGNDPSIAFSDPLWLALIAPPSTLKTGLLTALADATGAYILDSLTPQTFISGLVREQEPGAKYGLLHQLGERPNLIIKDLSGILSTRSDNRGEIISQFRCIYDGEYARATGTGGQDARARWRGRMTVIVGMTPIIDLYHTLNNQLGERFIQLRFAVAEDDVVAAAGQALENAAAGFEQRTALAAAFRAAIAACGRHLNRGALTPPLRQRLQNLVAFVAKARTGVSRNSKGDVEQPPSPEGPGRLTKQLAALACGLAALRGTGTLTEDDYRLVERVAFDSIPETRSKILWALYDRGARVLSGFRDYVKVSDPTIRKNLEDLALLGLAVEDATRVTKRYDPSPLGQRYLDAARGKPPTRKAKLGGDTLHNPLTSPHSPPKSAFQASEQPVGAHAQDSEATPSDAEDGGRA